MKYSDIKKSNKLKIISPISTAESLSFTVLILKIRFSITKYH